MNYLPDQEKNYITGLCPLDSEFCVFAMSVEAVLSQNLLAYSYPTIANGLTVAASIVNTKIKSIGG